MSTNSFSTLVYHIVLNNPIKTKNQILTILKQCYHQILSANHLSNYPYFFQISIPVCMSPEVNLLSFNIVFPQTKPEILHQYLVFFCCQRNLSLTLRNIQYEWIVPFHIPNLPAKCQIAVILLPQIYDYIVVYLHKSIFDTLYQITISFCCCAHLNHPFVFIIIYPFFTATTNMQTRFSFCQSAM